MRAIRKEALYGGRGMAALLLGPSLVLFVLFHVWPALDALWISMCSWTGFAPQAEFVGLANFTALAKDSRFRQALWNTLYYVLAGGLGHFFFAFLFAAALNNPRFAGRKFFQTLIFFPSFIAVVGTGILWSRLYSAKDGLINQLLHLFGGENVAWLSPDHALNAGIASSIWAGVGSQMILLLAGMRRIPTEYYEAARLDGAGEWQLFRHITLPMLKDVSYVALALWLIGSMQVFGLVQALQGPTIPLETETVSTYQYALSFNARNNIYLMGRGTAMAVVLVALIVLMVGLLRLIFGKRELEY